MLQWRYDIESVLDVPPEAFDPPPRVDSAVVRMQPLPTPGVDAKRCSASWCGRVLAARKLLRHTLGRWLDERGFAGEFDVQRRAEEVPVADYLALAAALN
jgi:16S rRNA (adenine1518-N6/adenine1519-N6)-dimethyltransferase